MKKFYNSLSEKDKRRYAAIEAQKLGWGGISYIIKLLGCTRNTIVRGIKELEELDDPTINDDGYVKRKAQKKQTTGINKDRNAQFENIARLDSLYDVSSLLTSLVAEPLNATQLSAFADRGYLVLSSFLPSELVATLKPEVDRWVDGGLLDEATAYCLKGLRQPPPVMELELGEHGWLIGYPPLMAILAQLMGPIFAFHHLHSSRHDSGSADKNWHHDYEQYPQTNRSHMMVHVFHYLDGLNGTIGDLVVLPGSQQIVAEKNALSRFGAMPLPGEVAIENLPPGSTVIIHSGVFHARRAKAGGEGQPRYLIDCAYCQGGVRWPVVKPYWQQMLARARALGLDRGQWHDLFAERHFYDPYDQMVPFKQINQGSLLERLMPALMEQARRG